MGACSSSTIGSPSVVGSVGSPFVVGSVGSPSVVGSVGSLSVVGSGTGFGFGIDFGYCFFSGFRWGIDVFLFPFVASSPVVGSSSVRTWSGFSFSSVGLWTSGTGFGFGVVDFGFWFFGFGFFSGFRFWGIDGIL